MTKESLQILASYIQNVMEDFGSIKHTKALRDAGYTPIEIEQAFAELGKELDQEPMLTAEDFEDLD